MARMLPPSEEELRLWKLFDGNDNKAGGTTKEEYAEFRELHKILYGENRATSGNASQVTHDYSQRMVHLLMMMS